MGPVWASSTLLLEQDMVTMLKVDHPPQDYPGALAAFSDALECLDSGEEDNELRAVLLSNRSLVQYGLGDWPAALRDAEAVLECAGPKHACFHKAVYRAMCCRLLLGCVDDRVGSLTEAAGGGGQPETALVTRRLSSLAASKVSSALHASEIEVRLEQALSALERDLVGEEEEGEEVDTGAALDEIAQGLEAHPSFLLLEERRCSRVLLALLSAYPDKVASVLRAAHATRDDGPGSRVLWSGPLWIKLARAAAAADASKGPADGTNIALVCLDLLGWAAGQDPWLAGHLLAVPLLSTAYALPQTLLQSLQRIGAGAKGAAVDADWVRAASGALAAFARSAPQVLAPGWTDGRPAAGTAEPLRVAASTFLALADARLTSSSGAQTIDAALAAQLPEAERIALDELQKKRAAVYNPDLVSCRHALLGFGAQLVVADGFSASAACIAGRHSGGFIYSL